MASKPAPLYGRECWTLGEADEKRIKSAQVKFLRLLLEASRRDDMILEMRSSLATWVR